MIDFKIKLENIQERDSLINLFEDIENQTQRKPIHDAAPASVCLPSTEYLLSLEAKHNFDGEFCTKKPEIIVVVDNSTSMRGIPWKQVQCGLIKLLNITRNSINCRVISYNQYAQQIKLTGCKDVDDLTINSIEVQGATNFVAAFKELEKFFVQNDDSLFFPHYIFFMTDGQDTMNSSQEIMKALEHLQEKIETFGGEVVFNVLGFSQHHDATFLENISLIGTSDGAYSFVSPQEGDKALEERLIALVEETTCTIGQTINVEAASNNIEFLSEWFGQSEKKVILPAKLTKTHGETKILTKKFVRISNNAETHILLNVYEELRGRTKPIKARVVKSETILLNDARSITTFNLRKLRAAMNMVIYRMRITDASKDTSVKAAYDIVKKQMYSIKDVDLLPNSSAKRHHSTVSGYINLCSRSLEPGNRNRVEAAMTSKGSMSSCMSSSCQQQNLCVQTPSPGMFSDSSSVVPNRTPSQMKVKLTDYSNQSDDEDETAVDNQPGSAPN